MREPEIFIQSVGTYLPPPEYAAFAVQQGRYSSEDHAANGITSVLVSPGIAPPDMAVLAARTAVAKASLPPAEISLLLHASLYHQGHDFWTPANYIQQQALGHADALALQINQASNGGLAALHLAVTHLRGDPACRAALVTTADRYCGPGFDRWKSDSTVVYSDGACAVVIARDTGPFRVRAVRSTSVPSLERMCRGREGFTCVPHETGGPLDIRARKSAYLQETGFAPLVALVGDAVAGNVATALASAKADMADVRWFILPHLGLGALEWEFLEPLGIQAEQTVWHWARTVGHLGAGDQFAALEYLLTSDACVPGDLVVMAGVGIGFNWTSVVLEVC